MLLAQHHPVAQRPRYRHTQVLARPVLRPWPLCCLQGFRSNSNISYSSVMQCLEVATAPPPSFFTQLQVGPS